MPSVIRGSDDFDSVTPIPSVSITAGTVANGGTIPLPSGYTRGQCKYAVWPYGCVVDNEYDEIRYSVNQTTGLVVAVSVYFDGEVECLRSASAGYLCIGVK